MILNKIKTIQIFLSINSVNANVKNQTITLLYSVQRKA